MNKKHATDWSLFRTLCRVLGGQDIQTLTDTVTAGLLPQLVDMARDHDLLPALAVRCKEQLTSNQAPAGPEAEVLEPALRDNTLCNMQISAQALKLTGALNRAGVTPLFLKGTVQLLTAENRNLGFRKQVDIDLLVEPAQLETAGEVFLADGYSFLHFPAGYSAEPIPLRDTSTALRISAAHHHLPPLAKAGYATTVELHRHFLPGRFQRKNPLGPLFSTAIRQESHGAVFLIPSTEYQMIHLILGKIVYGGHLLRRTLPLREACDYIDLLEYADGPVDSELVSRHCGRSGTIFSQLVAELMAYKTKETTHRASDITRRVQLMEKRYNSPGLAKLLDTRARAAHLGYSLLYSPAKLPAYLQRFGNSGN